MRYQVWARVPQQNMQHRSGPPGPWSAEDWRPLSRPFNEEHEAQDWALDLSDWFRSRMEIRRVGSHD